jgi:hypothetical protein
MNLTTPDNFRPLSVFCAATCMIAAFDGSALAVETPPGATSSKSSPPRSDKVAPLKIGAVVLGRDGSRIGTIEHIADDLVLVNTGAHVAPIARQSFGFTEVGPTINTTRSELDAMMDQQLAERAAKIASALLPGAEVVSIDQKLTATIAKVDYSQGRVVLKAPEGHVALRKEHFALDGEGRLMALFTADQIAETAQSVAK